ncbi:hypothetical protein BDC45DRAFT_542197 [Circinella umbellata]|nr:hypothetical protein BDC45DRAFT_542197 [Circinella umbellata]
MNSPSSPTSPTIANLAPAPWFPILKKSFTKNFLYTDDPVFISMSNIKRSGDASMHCLQFLSFLEDDPRFLQFPLAMNDNLLMGDIKSDPNASLSWTMPKSKEYYKLTGKFYIASAPIQVTRFPPPRVINDLAAQEFWEKERIKQWKGLDDKVRAMFTWPSRGEMPKADKVAFTCQSLKYSVLDPRKNNKTNDAQVVHDIAMDNFCLLVYKVSEVEYFDYSSFPPKRTLYTLKDNRWISKEANP